eukprot:11225490-Lingulodinium_polyedra.AAC.1
MAHATLRYATPCYAYKFWSAHGTRGHAVRGPLRQRKTDSTAPLRNVCGHCRNHAVESTLRN